MLTFFKKIYHKVSYRIFMSGQNEYYQRTLERYKKTAQIDQSSILYQTSEIRNLSGDPSKIKIGKNSHISGLVITYPYAGEISIGDYCSLSENSRIVSGKRITIGNRVMIAHNVNILDNNSHPIDAKERHKDFKEHYTVGMQKHKLKASEIIIEDDVWIGFNSTILKGVKIGRGAIIGAGSFVTKDIEPWTINTGHPAKCIKKVNETDI